MCSRYNSIISTIRNQAYREVTWKIRTPPFPLEWLRKNGPRSVNSAIGEIGRAFPPIMEGAVADRFERSRDA